MVLLGADSLVSSRIGESHIRELLNVAMIRLGNQRLVLSVSSRTARAAAGAGERIGWDAVCTAVNQAAAAGARPVGVAAGVTTPRDLPAGIRHAVIAGVSDASAAAGVPLAALDTDQTPAGGADDVNVTALVTGAAPRRPRVHQDFLAPRDVILVNRAAGHGPDVGPLNGLIARVLKAVPGVIFVRDVTRPGIAGACRDIAARSGLHVRLDVDVEDAVDAEDDRDRANVLFFVRPANVERALAILRRDRAGATARAVGAIEE